MANLIAFELDDQQLLVATAHMSAGRLQVQSAQSIPLSDESDEQVGKMIADLLGRKRGRCEAIAIVGRSSAEIREITVPPAPDHELADMVRFQARNEFGQLNDNWALDFVPFPGPEDAPRRVLASAISPQLVDQLNAVATAAGVKLRNIVFRPYATVNLLRTELSEAGVSLIVDQTGDQTDLTICNGKSVITTRTVRIPANCELETRTRQLKSEIGRTITSATSRLGGGVVSQVVVCGDEAETKHLREELSSALQLTVQSAQPFSKVSTAPALMSNLPGRTQRFSALLGGLLQNQSDASQQIDFLNPRKVIEQKADYKKYYKWAALVAMIALLLVGGAWWMLRSQQAEIARLEENLFNLREAANEYGYEDGIREGESLASWYSRELNWLDQLGEVSDGFYSPDEAIVDKFNASLGRKEPLVEITGRTKDVDSDHKIKKEMEKFWRNPIDGGRTGNTSGDKKYSQTFKISGTPIVIDTAVRMKELDKLILARSERLATQPVSVPAEAGMDAGTKTNTDPESGDVADEPAEKDVKEGAELKAGAEEREAEVGDEEKELESSDKDEASDD